MDVHPILLHPSCGERLRGLIMVPISTQLRGLIMVPISTQLRGLIMVPISTQLLEKGFVT
jgi:hypothetical protein